VVSGISIDEPAEVVVGLLDALRKADAGDQIRALLARDPAAHAVLTTAKDAMRLLESLQAIHAEDEIRVLHERLVRFIPLDDPGVVADLLDGLRRTRNGEQITALLHRNPAANAPLADLAGVSSLLIALKKAGAKEQIDVLAQRIAGQTDLTDPGVVVCVLEMLTYAGEDSRIRELLDREPAASVLLDDAREVCRLIGTLKAAHGDDQLAVLLNRDPAAHVSFDDLSGLGDLLRRFVELQADDQVAALLDRDPGGTASVRGIYGPELVIFLTALRDVGAHRQIVAFADHVAEDVPLDDPDDVGIALIFLASLRAWEPIETLLDRDPASNAALDDHEGILMLLDGLLTVGASDQIEVLTERIARTAPIEDCESVADVAYGLQMVGAEDQIKVWLGREPARHVELKDITEVLGILGVFQDVEAEDQIRILLDRILAEEFLPEWYDESFTYYVEDLRRIGAAAQLEAMIERLPAAGLFDAFVDCGGDGPRFRFGRELDGAPARPWNWDDLD
jgi:uncharacterized protein YidB (DUF937 family)